MNTTVICPDCGGVIGAGAQNGQKPCICDSSPAPDAPRPGMPDPVPKPRVCCKCGKDLNHKKRFKDSLGYWCEACHYAEKREALAGHVPCDACGRYVESRKLNDYEGIKLCTRCIKERQREGRKVRRPVVFGDAHRKQERKTIITLALIAAGLLLIIILKSLQVI